MSEVSPANSVATETGKPASFLQTRLYAVLIPLAFLVGLGAGFLLWGREAEVAETAAATAQEGGQEAPVKVTRYDVPVDDDPYLGPENAAITIIEFSDYQCPYCTRWHAEVWPRLQETYPNQVRLVYRDFPLTSIHPDAAPAAEAANCAAEQDAYWPFHEKLFAGENGLGKSAYQEYARELGLDLPSFEECLQERRYKGEVEADLDYAFNLGVRSTPTFFINGIALVGAQPFEVFKDVIDKELAGEIPE